MNISQLNMGISFDGSSADQGMSQTAKATEEFGKKVEETGKKIEKSEKTSWSNILALGTMAKKAWQTAASFTGLVTQAEDLAIRFANLAGSWKNGVSILKDLQGVSTTTGVDLGKLSDAFVDLTASGYSSSRALDLIQKAGNLDGLLGGGGAGFQALAGALANLNDSATTSLEVFTALKKKGMDGTGELVKRMEQLTGKTLSTTQALSMIKDGALLGGTGAGILEDILNGPQAKQAQDRFEASFSGQFARLQSEVTEIFRDVGLALFKAFPVKEVTASLRGGLAGAREIVGEITNIFGEWADPSGKLGVLRGTFENMKSIVIEIGKELVSAIQDAKKWWDGIENTTTRIGARLTWWKEFYEAESFGAVGAANKKFNDTIAAIENKEARAEFERNMAPLEAETRLKEMMRTGEGIAAKGSDAMEWEQFFEEFWDNEETVFQKVDEAAQKAAEAMKDMKRSAEEWTLSMRSGVMTTLEKFSESMDKIRIKEMELGQLTNGLLKWQSQEIVRRQKIQSIRDLIGQNSVGTSYLASRAERGSQAEFDTIMRFRYGDQSQNPQERIAQAVEKAARMAELEVEYGRRLLEAFDRVPKPAAIFAVPKV